MKHIWSIICEDSSIDFEKNSLSMFNCVEEIKLIVNQEDLKNKNDKKIVIPVKFQIISFWIIDDFNKDNNLDIKIELVDSNKKVISNFENTIKTKKGTKRFRNRTNVNGLPITSNGRYYFNIYQKENNKFKLVSELPLDVEMLKDNEINKKK